MEISVHCSHSVAGVTIIISSYTIIALNVCLYHSFGLFSRKQIDDIFSYFSPKTGFDSLCKLSPMKPVFWEKYEKYFKMLPAEIFTKRA